MSTRQEYSHLTVDADGSARITNTRRKTLKQVFDQTHKAMAPKYGKWVIFEHCMPFCVSRAYDEAKGISHPRIWTARRDIEMWKELQG